MEHTWRQMDLPTLGTYVGMCRQNLNRRVQWYYITDKYILITDCDRHLLVLV